MIYLYLTLPVPKGKEILGSVMIACVYEVLQGLPERMGSDVSRPTVYSDYASPSFQIFLAMLWSRSSKMEKSMPALTGLCSIPLRTAAGAKLTRGIETVDFNQISIKILLQNEVYNKGVRRLSTGLKQGACAAIFWSLRGIILQQTCKCLCQGFP